MLPLVLKTKNSVGFTDFDDGLPADIFYQESVGSIKNNLGTVEEPLLREALLGLGIAVPPAREPYKTDKIEATPEQVITSPLDGVMYFDQEDRKSTRLNSSHVAISY